ncbi:hypothetical protein NGM37_22855, partial [Streptomyces sp. TRM76130]|nr:hypothetical protein [Streptomyces sp. TRM76130]
MPGQRGFFAFRLDGSLSSAEGRWLGSPRGQPDGRIGGRVSDGGLGLPADEPPINVTRSRLGRLVRQGLREQPGRGR